MLDYPTIEEVVEILGLERKKHGSSFKVRCPFCWDGNPKHFTMDINTEKGVYYCFHCETNGGLLDLYGRVALGIPLQKGPNGNSKEIFKALQQVRGKSGSYQYNTTNHQKTEYVNIYPEKDSRLNDVYRCILSLPEFSLSDDHKRKLKARGLSDEAIETNQYRSIPSDDSWTKGYIRERAEYEVAGIEQMRGSIPALSRYSKSRMIASMIIGQRVAGMVGEPKQIPGFFKINGKWFFRMESGMLIPTRNHRGQIVAFQVRKDKGDLRYMTLSSKGFPEGVTTRIARTHFPLKNATFKKDTIVIITEGPLKADVALHLLKEQGRTDNIAFISLHGVMARKDLPKILQYLNRVGIRKVYNAFDMDRLLNPSVMKAVKGLKADCEKQDIRLMDLYWDEDEGRRKVKELKNFLLMHGYVCTLDEPWYQALPMICMGLAKKNIPYCQRKDEKGKISKDYWSAESKGIDDYLLLLKSR